MTNIASNDVAEALIELFQNRDQTGGLRLTYDALCLRHFTARLEPIQAIDIGP